MALADDQPVLEHLAYFVLIGYESNFVHLKCLTSSWNHKVMALKHLLIPRKIVSTQYVFILKILKETNCAT